MQSQSYYALQSLTRGTHSFFFFYTRKVCIKTDYGICAGICTNKSQIHEVFVGQTVNDQSPLFRSLSERSSRGQKGGWEEWEARDEWNQPAVVWSVPRDGRTPPSRSDSNSLSLLLSQSLKSLSPGFSEQKEAPTGGSPFSLTHEMMRTTQPLPHRLRPPSLSPNSSAREDYSPPHPTPQNTQTVHIYLPCLVLSDVG